MLDLSSKMFALTVRCDPTPLPQLVPVGTRDVRTRTPGGVPMGRCGPPIDMKMLSISDTMRTSVERLWSLSHWMCWGRGGVWPGMHGWTNECAPTLAPVAREGA